MFETLFEKMNFSWPLWPNRYWKMNVYTIISAPMGHQTVVLTMNYEPQGDDPTGDHPPGNDLQGDDPQGGDLPGG
jgi:hypothetical protein